MSTPTLRKNYLAKGAITQYRIVKYGAADGEILQATASTEALLGVMEEKAAVSGDRRDIVIAGLSEVEFGGNVTRGQPLTADADGKAVAATQHTHTENTAGAYTQNATTGAVTAVVRIIGFAEVSGVAGDIGTVRIAPGLI